MKTLSSILAPEKLGRLRSNYNPEAMTQANIRAVSTVAPQLAAWNQEIGNTFYAADGIISPRDRERCLLALLSVTNPTISMATHVYWGLMEGLSVEEIVHVVGLAGCYGGLPKMSSGLEVVYRVLTVLNDSEPDASPTHVMAQLLREFSPSLTA